jgi:hypothetical protein
MPSTLVHGVRMTTLAVGISTSAHYGDPECPANPRCADLFTDPRYWGSNFYGIGGSEQVRLYLGTIRVGGVSHTLLVGLDAEGHSQLLRLTATGEGMIRSLRVPASVTGG